MAAEEVHPVISALTAFLTAQRVRPTLVSERLARMTARGGQVFPTEVADIPYLTSPFEELMRFVRIDRIDGIRHAIARGSTLDPPLNWQFDNGEIIVKAAKYGSVKAIEYFLTGDTRWISDLQLYNAVMQAIRHDHRGAVKFLLNIPDRIVDISRRIPDMPFSDLALTIESFNRIAVLHYLTTGLPEERRLDLRFEDDVLLRLAIQDHNLPLTIYYVKHTHNPEVSNLALVLAVQSRDLHTVKYVLERAPVRADIHFHEDEALVEAVQLHGSDENIVRYLLTKDGEKANPRAQGDRPLFDAANLNKIDIVQQLLEEIRSRAAVPPPNFIRLLVGAAIRNHPVIVRMLVEHGADPTWLTPAQRLQFDV